MGKTALVTGATGFVAAHLIPVLVEDGWQVRASGRRARPDDLPDEVDYRSVDLAEGEGLDELLDGVTHLFHLAGASSTKSSQEEMHRSNVVGTEQLLSAGARCDLERVCYMSSTSVYGEEVQLPLPVVEDVEPQPSRGYGKAKWEAEQVVWRHGRDGMAVVVLRPVSTYGPGNVKLLGSAVLDAAIERFAGLPRLAVHDEPVEQRLLHIDDLVAACLHVMAVDEAVGRAFNVVSVYPSSHEVAEVLAEEFGMELELSDDPDCGLDHDRRQEVHRAMLDQGMVDAIALTPDRFRFMRKSNRNNRVSVDALLETGFGFREPDFPAGAAKTIEWYRRNRWVL